jgi:hypothetical protein
MDSYAQIFQFFWPKLVREARYGENEACSIDGIFQLKKNAQNCHHNKDSLGLFSHNFFMLKYFVKFFSPVLSPYSTHYYNSDAQTLICSQTGPHIPHIFIRFHRYGTAISFEVFTNLSSFSKHLMSRSNKGVRSTATSPYAPCKKHKEFYHVRSKL